MCDKYKVVSKEKTKKRPSQMYPADVSEDTRTKIPLYAPPNVSYQRSSLPYMLAKFSLKEEISRKFEAIVDCLIKFGTGSLSFESALFASNAYGIFVLATSEELSIFKRATALLDYY